MPEDRSRVSVSGRVITEAFAQLKHTLVEIRKYRHTVRFLLARLLYNDGLVTVFAFGGIYAAGTRTFAAVGSTSSNDTTPGNNTDAADIVVGAFENALR